MDNDCEFIALNGQIGIHVPLGAVVNYWRTST